MIQEMKVMHVAANQEKQQIHNDPFFLCDAFFANWRRDGMEGVPWHWHAEIELMYVAEGQAEVDYGDQQADIAAGDGFFFNSHVLHQIHVKGSGCLINYLVLDASLVSGGVGTVYDRKYVRPLIEDMRFPGMPLDGRKESTLEVIRHIRAAYEAFKQEPAGYEYEVRYHASKALLGLYELRPGDAEKMKGHGLQMERVKEMLKYIHQHYGEPVALGQIARWAGVSEREVQRCFHAILHTSPMGYLQRYRIQVASERLLDTTDSILDIGMDCGFSNPSHFSKVFRSCRHCTPQEFRRKNI